MLTNGTVWLLGDPEAAEVLTRLFGSRVLPADSLRRTCADDEVWVYAHAATAKGVRRTDHGGLAWLQRALCDMELPLNVPIRVLGFLPQDSYGRFTYLLGHPSVAYHQLPVEPVWEPPVFTSSARAALALAASEHELEIGFAAERHRFRGLAAAVRIYLGLLLAGHAQTGDAREVLRRAAASARSQGIEVSLDIERLLDAIRNHHRLLDRLKEAGVSPPPPYTEPMPQLAVRMLDDQSSTHLWHEVMPAICRAGGYVGFRRWKDLQAYFREQTLECDTVLLVDCNLGPQEATGLELLPALRRAYPELRIVLMSSYDDAQLALTCIRAGASGYFVKELTDPEDRGSLNYYAHFVRTLSPSDSAASAVARLWRVFQRRLSTEGLSPKDPDLALPLTLESQLRFAFYVAFSETEGSTWATWGGMPPDLRSSLCSFAIADVLFAGWEREQGPRHWPRTRLLADRLRHPEPGAELSLSEGLCLLKSVLSRLRRQGSHQATLGTPQMPLFSPYSADQLRADGSHPGRNASPPSLSHGAAGARSSAELARGWLCTSGCWASHCGLSAADILKDHRVHTAPSGPYADVLVVDDEGETNGWFQVLQARLPGVRTRTMEQLRAASDCAISSELQSTNLVLLDLRMPGAEDGLAALDRVRRLDPSVPVVMASASTETLDAVRCLRRGALGYLCKSLPFERDAAQCGELHRGFMATVEFGRTFGDSELRAVWRHIACLRSQVAWALSPEVAEHWERLTATHDRALASLVCSPPATPTLYAPPEPQTWAPWLADALSLVAAIYHNQWLIRALGSHAAGGLGGSPACMPLDLWRFELLLGDSEAAASRLVVLLAGGIVDLLARWSWCWRHDQQLIVEAWGNNEVPRNQRIVIGDEVSRLDGGQDLWRWRNAAVYPTKNPPEWNFTLIEHAIERVFRVLASFKEAVGWR